VPGVSDVIKLAAGEASTCALSEDGSVRCWGANGEGELGLGTRSPDERPAAVSSLSNVREICLASAHGCALTKDGKVLCWERTRTDSSATARRTPEHTTPRCVSETRAHVDHRMSPARLRSGARGNLPFTDLPEHVAAIATIARTFDPSSGDAATYEITPLRGQYMLYHAPVRS
jgi:hypothetical protein